jgi:hypothetical protein
MGDKKPKGMVIMIAVGGGQKPRPHGHPSPNKKEGCEMIKIPLEALVSESEEGEQIPPQEGDAVVLESVEGEVVGIDGPDAHIELISANGAPIEYVEQMAKEAEDDIIDDAEADALLEMAEEEDLKAGY